MYQAYEKAIGKENMSVLSSFSKLPMYNFGVRVVSDMNDVDKAYLEQNIQVALAQKEIDLEDAIAIRQLRDIDQAERLLVVRRKKRIKQQQETAAMNSQMQAQMNQQTAMASSQGKMQEEQMKAQIDAQRIQIETQAKAQLMQLEYELKMQLENLKGNFGIAEQRIESGVKQNLENEKEDRKDERVKKQAVQQSKLISQRKGERPELEDEENIVDVLLNEEQQ